MITRKIFVCLFICLFVCNCIMAGRENIPLANIYFENLYEISPWGNEIVVNKAHFASEVIKFNDVNAMHNTYFTNTYYQDFHRTCFLFAYTTLELIKMKEQAGFNKESTDAIFMIGRDGISVVSRAEYEKLKPTFKPHPYDASLCKPAPKQ